MIDLNDHIKAPPWLVLYEPVAVSDKFIVAHSNDGLVLLTELSGPPEIVIIDITPKKITNRIDARTHGKIRVAIISTDTFDATTVNWTTVRFGATGTEAAPLQVLVKDVNHDGLSDLLLKFDAKETGIACGATVAFLTGETFDGQVIAASNSIKTPACKSKSSLASKG